MFCSLVANQSLLVCYTTIDKEYKKLQAQCQRNALEIMQECEAVLRVAHDYSLSESQQSKQDLNYHLPWNRKALLQNSVRDSFPVMAADRQPEMIYLKDWPCEKRPVRD